MTLWLNMTSISDLIFFFYFEPDTFRESYRIYFFDETVSLARSPEGIRKFLLLRVKPAVFGTVGDVSVRKSGRARQVSVFLREPLFTLRYAGVRIHFAARNRRPGICEMKEAVGPRPSPLPVAAVWTISSGSYYTDLIH